MKDCILFYVKYPEPGEVKTRLADDCSPELAAEFYTVLVEEKLAELSKGCEADILICYAPEKARRQMTEWLGKDYRYIAQKGSDLGRRMENGFREAFFMGYDRVVLVGSDIPGLTPEIINEGLTQLIPETASLGPADDGGYYLIGFPRSGIVPTIFQNMDWSTDTVFQTTLTRLEDNGATCHILPSLEDIDTYEDLETLAALGSAGPLSNKALQVARKITGM